MKNYKLGLLLSFLVASVGGCGIDVPADPPESGVTEVETVTEAGEQIDEKALKLLAKPEKQPELTECQFHASIEGEVNSFASQANPEIESSWQMMAFQLNSSNDAIIDELFVRAAMDAFIRENLLLGAENYHEAIPAEADEPALVECMQKTDRSNADWLNFQINQRGWFTVRQDGRAANFAAWLIVQHADFDVPFQRKVLNLISASDFEKYEAGERYAMLVDRVAVNSGEKQVFATQGSCVAPGNWEPRSTLGDAASVESERALIGLPKLSEYVEKMSSLCN